MRARYLAFGLLTTPATAEVWQLHPSLGIRAADVYLSSTSDAAGDLNASSSSTLKALGAGLRLMREDNASLWETDARLQSSETDGVPYGESLLKTRYQAKEKLAATNFDIAYRQNHGFDPLNPLIEEAANGNDQSFQSIHAGVYHQVSLSVADDISLYLGGGENQDGTIQIKARDAQISWDHHHSVLWTSRLRARYAEAETKQREIAQEHIIRLSPKLSTDLSYGYGWQNSDDSGGENRSEGALWGASLRFQTSGLGTSQSAYESVAPVREITEEQTESLRGSAMYTLGWTHSRDRRRVGDPYYYADILYGSTKFEVVTDQTFEAKGSQSRASRKQLVDSQNSYQSELLQGIYTIRHRFWSRYPDADLALSYSSERTAFQPQRYVRQVYEASYALTW